MNKMCPENNEDFLGNPHFELKNVCYFKHSFEKKSFDE
jgi:hypothetical protein